MDHRHRSRYYCRAHIQSWVASPLGSQEDYFPHILVRESTAGASSFMWTTLDALSLSVLQVRVMQCEQWAPTGRHIWIYGMEDKTKPCQSHNAGQKCAVCVHASVYIWRNEPEHAKQAMWLWTAISSCGAVFMMRGIERLTKHSRYILKCTRFILYLSSFLFDKQLNVLVYTQRKIKV